MPCSERRLAANRRNAQKSTGPKTAQGKRVASQNARKHGMRAANIDLSEYFDADRFTSIFAGFCNEQPPDSEAEVALMAALAAKLSLSTNLLNHTETLLEGMFDEQRIPVYAACKAGALEYKLHEEASRLLDQLIAIRRERTKPLPTNLKQTAN